MSTTEKEKRYRGWTFTINNYSDADYLAAEGLKELANYLIIGKEVGKKGTPHLQGYCYLKNPRGFKSMTKLLLGRAHIEVAKGNSEQNREYCSKEKEFVEFGEISTQGQRNDLEFVRELLDEGANMRKICDEVPSYQCLRSAELIMKYKEAPRTEKPNSYWYWGPSGRGKTHAALEKAHSLGSDIYHLVTEKWWDGYDGHEIVIIDDFRPSMMPLELLLKMLDGNPFRVQNKGGTRQLKAKHIFITSPFSPAHVYPSFNVACEISEGRREDATQLIRRLTEVRKWTNEDVNHSNLKYLENLENC